MMLPDAVHDRLWQEAEGRYVYAILDGAQNENLLDLLQGGDGPEFRCLLPGELEPDMAEVAPYLVQLEPESAFTHWLMTQGWGQNWGIFLVSEKTLAPLWQALRRQVLTYGPDLEPMYFRFYDPRVLREFLPMCTGEHLLRFFDGVSFFVAEGENPGRGHVWSMGNGKIVAEEVGSSSKLL